MPPSSNVALLCFANSSESATGTTSSARLCRNTVSAFTVLTVPYFFLAAADIHGDAPAPARPHDDLVPVRVELGLGDLDGLGEIYVRRRGVDDLVAVVFRVRRLDAADHRVSTVKEEGFQETVRLTPIGRTGETSRAFLSRTTVGFFSPSIKCRPTS